MILFVYLRCISFVTLSEVYETGRGQDFSKFERDESGYVKPLEDAEVAHLTSEEKALMILKLKERKGALSKTAKDLIHRGHFVLFAPPNRYL